MPQYEPRASQGTKRRRYEEQNNDKTNAIYETTDAETKKKCNRGATLEQ